MRNTFSLRLLAALFLLSGVAALTYQLIWQRALFRIYGIDIVSVTVVVTAFLLGLGLGSLLGGAVSRRVPERALIPLFAAIELGIGLYGVFSLRLFAWVGSATAGATSPLGTGVLSFALVLLPTLLMGSTLPILVAWLTARWGNVGRSVGVLYGATTLGSGVACLLTAAILLGALGLQATTAVAAAMNALVAGTVLWAWRRRGAAEGGAS
ncbi:MAG: hypothetical protein ACE5JG_05180 [Planctomycetota bacterium]